MQKVWTAGLLASLAVAGLACDRSKAEAVELSNEGDTSKKGGNLEGAIAKWEEGAQLDPDNHRILYRLVQAYRKKEDWEKVASSAVKAQRADEKLNGKKMFASYYFEQGVALSRIAASGKGKWADARQPLETAIQLDPNMAQAYFELAEVLLRVDDEKGAIDNYNKAIEKNPESTDFYGPLAGLYVNLNFVAQAEQVLKEGLSFAKENDKRIFNLRAQLGQTLELKGDLSSAIREYEAAKKSCGVCDDHKEAHFLLGAAYYAANPPRKNEASSELQKFYKTACKGASAVRFRAECDQTMEFSRKLGTNL
jgi:tetratricopeptide (TPR) repeat protein